MSMLRLLSLLVLLLCPTVLLAKPIEVLIFPSGALVTEESSEPLSNGRALLFLPSVADPASLKISPLTADLQINGLRYESVLEESGNYQQLEAQLEAAQDKKQFLGDQTSSKMMALDYWKQQLKIDLKSPEEAKAMGSLVLESSEPLFADISKLEKDKKQLDKEIKELQRQLAQATGQQSRKWVVSVDLSGAGNLAELRFSYRVSNASWSSLYTLDARPNENQVAWTWVGAVQQATGQAWNNVQLRLATAEPLFTLTPPAVGSWIIREQHSYPAAKSVANRQMVAMEMAEDQAAMAPAEVPPARMEGALFDIYDLGRQTIEPGKTYQLNIRKGTWPATFSYLVRPIQTPQAFLSAKLAFKDLLPLPGGQASLLVDGVFVGKRPFGLREKTIDLAFGNDPGVAVQVDSERESDESGLISKDRSQQWTWGLSIVNHKSHPVKVRIEDSYPQVQDRRIELSEIRTTASAGVTREEGLAFWEVEVAAGNAKHIEYGYKVTFPAEMPVDLGR